MDGDDHHAHANAAAGMEIAGQAKTYEDGSPVQFRKSCDLCVRLKRACDGKNPCHLCIRRRETCTRRVKRKSGPAKGTKYTTRRSRMEAGIAEPADAKSKNNKTRVPRAGQGGGRGEGSGRGRGRGGRGVGGGTPSKKGSQENLINATVVSQSPIVSIKLSSPVSQQLQDTSATSSATPAGVGAGIGGRGKGRGRENVGGHPGGIVGVGDGRGLLGHGVVVGGGRSTMHTTAEVPSAAHPHHHQGGPLLAPGDGMDLSSGREEGTGGRNSGGSMHINNVDNREIHHQHQHPLQQRHHRHSSSVDSVVPRRSFSPLSLPTLSWSSPIMAPGTSSAILDGVNGGGLGGAGLDHHHGGRGGLVRSTSPFGLLSGPPPGLGEGVNSMPRRGGTREPPVEAGAGPGHMLVHHMMPGHHHMAGAHFRGPPGGQPPPSKRYRMSPPFLPRDTPPLQRTGDEHILGPPMSLLSGAGIGSPERSGAYRQGTSSALLNEPRSHLGGGGAGPPLFIGNAYLSAGVPPSSQGSSVGSFDSSNALGAILDARHRGSNGFIRGSGGRVGSRTAANNGVSLSRVDQDWRPGDSGDDAAAHVRRQQQQFQDEYSRQGMRFLPPPPSGGRVSSAMEGRYNDMAAARWREPDDPGADRSIPEVSRWRAGGGSISASGGRNQHHQHPRRAPQGGVGGGGGGGIEVDSTRDLLAEAAAAGRSNDVGGWISVGGGGGGNGSRTVVVTHAGDRNEDVGCVGGSGGDGGGEGSPLDGGGGSFSAGGGGETFRGGVPAAVPHSSEKDAMPNTNDSWEGGGDSGAERGGATSSFLHPDLNANVATSSAEGESELATKRTRARAEGERGGRESWPGLWGVPVHQERRAAGLEQEGAWPGNYSM